ncbi:hypothetical protein HDV63DRAFT_175932 [Trichoderma sp. SZMC 28014]
MSYTVWGAYCMRESCLPCYVPHLGPARGRTRPTQRKSCRVIRQHLIYCPQAALFISVGFACRVFRREDLHWRKPWIQWRWDQSPSFCAVLLVRGHLSVSPLSPFELGFPGCVVGTACKLGADPSLSKSLNDNDPMSYLLYVIYNTPQSKFGGFVGCLGLVEALIATVF